MALNYTKLDIEELKLMTRETIKPEPQYSLLTKYLAHYYDNEHNQKEAIVYLANSHGLQLRSDLKYWTDKRKEADEETKKAGPVLDCSNLSLFKNFQDVVEKIKNFPEEWTVIQITKTYNPIDVLKEMKDSSEPGIFITRFPCGKLAGSLNPYFVQVKAKKHIEENFIQLFKDLVKIRRDYFTSGGISRKIKEEYSNTDSGLLKLLFELENHWLKEWRCLLGGGLEDKTLEAETRLLVKKAVDNFHHRKMITCRYKEESLDIIYQVVLAAHSLKNREILKILNYAIFNDKQDSEKELIPLMEELKRINLGNSCAVKRAKKNPVILIIDNALEIIPWEMLSLLSGQPVCRILSLHLLYGLFKYHEPNIVHGYRRLKVDGGFCLINPSKDLRMCEKEMTQFLKAKMPWIETEVGKIPDPKLLVNRLQDTSVFFYCGHGSGMQYLNSGDLKKSFVKGLVMLFGCSSNLPKSAGGRTPYHNDTYTYITNGCPCLIGCIYDITSSDADKACKEMLSSFLPSLIVEDCGQRPKILKEANVLRGIAAARTACRKFWSQCSFVARGIPCWTVEGSFDRN